jgi:glucose-1-phosphate thymidylyltransferase
VIGPHVTLGEGTKLKNVIVRNSIIEAGTQVTDMVIEGSLIGRNVVLEGKPDKLSIGDNSWLTK